MNKEKDLQLFGTLTIGDKFTIGEYGKLFTKVSDTHGSYCGISQAFNEGILTFRVTDELKELDFPKGKFPVYDSVGAIIAYESGELDEEGIIELFQNLIDTGLAWQLQGSYGRTANVLIDTGHCTRKAN